MDNELVERVAMAALTVKKELQELRQQVSELTVENERLRNRINIIESGTSISDVHVKLLQDTTTLAQYGAEIGNRLDELDTELEKYRAAVERQAADVRSLIREAEAEYAASDEDEDG